MMSDIVDPATRSRMMRAVGRSATAPEMALRRRLHASGFRYRLNAPELSGKPDLVLTRYRAVAFVHGCFWHRHSGCKLASTPVANREYWLKKFEGNEARDRRNIETLERGGWR